jgi:hypothetical protein
MRNKIMLLAATAAVYLLGAQPAYAIDDKEFQALREQLLSLSQRLDELERSNQELKAENARLQESRGEADVMIAELGKTTEQLEEKVAAEAKADAWADRIKLKGDFRFRHEAIDLEGSDERRRQRIRARAAIIADVTENVEVGLGFASGGDDPVSTNQTLGGGGSTKDIKLDLAYFNWSGLENTQIIGGKFKNILHRAGKNGLLWDGDWNTEGAGVAWDNGNFFANAIGTYLESDTRKKDTEFSYGGQVGFKHAFDQVKLTAGIGYYRIDTKGKGPFFGDDDDFFGNSYDPLTNTYLYNYHELEAFAELGFDLAGKPLSFFFNYVQNQDAPENDTGYAGGVKFGSASAPQTWELGYVYQDLEADAVYGLLTDSDFGGGGTDARGHILTGGYAIAKNWKANVTYFINEVNISSDDPRDFDRLQLDLNFKY